jgi:hypothetical protein
MRKAAEFFSIQWMQAVHYDNFGGVDLLWISKGASLVVVNRLHDRFSASEAANVVGHQGNVVGIGVESRDTSTQARCPIKCMVIVEADMHNTFLSKDPYHTIG